MISGVFCYKMNVHNACWWVGVGSNPPRRVKPEEDERFFCSVRSHDERRTKSPRIPFEQRGFCATGLASMGRYEGINFVTGVNENHIANKIFACLF